MASQVLPATSATRDRSFTSLAKPQIITIKVKGIDVEVAPNEGAHDKRTLIRLLNGQEFRACRDHFYYFAHQFHLEKGVLVLPIFSTAKPSSSLIVDEEEGKSAGKIHRFFKEPNVARPSAARHRDPQPSSSDSFIADGSYSEEPSTLPSEKVSEFFAKILEEMANEDTD